VKVYADEIEKKLKFDEIEIQELVEV